jgi:CTP synthase (UTP-ammonia lyase)
MTSAQLDARPVRIAVVGDRMPGSAPQTAIETALDHSAAALGTAVQVTWFATPALAEGADGLLADADAVWCAPGSPYRSLAGALEGIRYARELHRPFLGTCAGFQHGVVEFARNVLGLADAAHQEYGDDGDAGPMVVSELLCSLAGQTMTVETADPVTREIYGANRVEERYYCRFGLQDSYLPPLTAAGLVVAGTDPIDGGTRILRLTEHPFFLLTLFVPQTSSTPLRPHPLVTAFLAAARAQSASGAPNRRARPAPVNRVIRASPPGVVVSTATPNARWTPSEPRR